MSPEAAHQQSDALTFDSVAVSIDLSLDTLPENVISTNTLPLVITPRSDASLPFLMEWLAKHRCDLDSLLTTHGAILLRGFDIETAADMEHAVLSYEPNLCNQYNGTSPRNLQKECRYLFSAAEVPSYFTIPQHLEMSYLPSAPRKVFFGCLEPSKSRGGETALCDFRKVYRQLPDYLRRKLLQQGVLYTRIHEQRPRHSRFDVSHNTSWPKLFGTHSKSQAEQICAKTGTEYEWHGSSFVAKTYSEAFQLHPLTNEPVWFNHIAVYHNTSFPVELLLSFWRTGEWRLLVHLFGMIVYCVFKYGILRHRMALHATYGDGSEFSWKDLYHIRKAIHQHMVYPQWQQGDLLLIDNFSTSHGRQPTFDSKRNVVVAWSQLQQKSNRLSCDDLNQEKSEYKKILHTTEHVT